MFGSGNSEEWRRLEDYTFLDVTDGSKICIQKGKPFRDGECLLSLTDAHLFIFMGFHKVSAAKGS